MAGERNRGDVIQIANFPLDLHRKLKSIAALKGLKLREAFIEAVEQWCRENG